MKVGQTVVVAKGAHAKAIVSHAHRAGMMGKGGELNIQLEYLAVADNHVRLRGTKGREGDSKVGATVALTVLFGPIGLIKHGKEVQIPAGNASHCIRGAGHLAAARTVRNFHSEETRNLAFATGSMLVLIRGRDDIRKSEV